LPLQKAEFVAAGYRMVLDRKCFRVQDQAVQPF
jgi:hypothetical protein